MKSQPERLNDLLEEKLQARRGAAMSGELHAHAISREDDEINDLLEIAQYLHSTPTMQVDNEFAQRLEARVRAHAINIQQKCATLPWWQTIFLHPLRRQIAVATMSVCLLLGTGAIAMAAQGATPANPLYFIKSLVQNTQQALIPSPLDKAEQAQQSARDHLNTLKTLANPTQEKAYNHELASLEQQLRLASQIIDTIQDGKDRKRLNGELTALRAQASSTLHNLLPMLSSSEQLATTGELKFLGEKVIYVKEATISISTSSHPQVTITITGNNFQPGAQLLINNQLISSTGTLKNGVYTFNVDWNGKQRPAVVSLLNPDDTLAQTTLITPPTNDASKKNGSSSNPGKEGTGSSSNAHDHGNSTPNNNGEPKSNPTPPTPRH
ncbi:hypothetical protein [Dictyobacter formicarum]|uniref:DUF5667 domain-containing protein n=1 Tax=Dictyobacter formicarum TaxID=2778368 RepID=A0ABQ3VTS2_9CHLR|nr:hypothetical protein [Dictyobacter formicarum]GHO88958.1 hypothetical protein KSZ_69640 [Dictyobacter formicarum]